MLHALSLSFDLRNCMILIIVVCSATPLLVCHIIILINNNNKISSFNLKIFWIQRMIHRGVLSCVMPLEAWPT